MRAVIDIHARRLPFDRLLVSVCVARRGERFPVMVRSSTGIRNSLFWRIAGHTGPSRGGGVLNESASDYMAAFERPASL